MFALVATSAAGTLKEKRGIFGSPEADFNHGVEQRNGGFQGYNGTY